MFASYVFHVCNYSLRKKKKIISHHRLFRLHNINVCKSVAACKMFIIYIIYVCPNKVHSYRFYHVKSPNFTLTFVVLPLYFDKKLFRGANIIRQKVNFPSKLASWLEQR